jgi:hypothetical protein
MDFVLISAMRDEHSNEDVLVLPKRSGGAKRDRTGRPSVVDRRSAVGRCLFEARCSLLLGGGAKRDRTADLLRARQALSQLSYSP